MKTRKVIQSLAAGAIAASFSVSAFAIDIFTHPLGTPAPAVNYGRIIKLEPSTKYLNVTQNDTVTIVNGDKSFGWTFDTLGTPNFELAKIAPQGFGTGHIRVYVRERNTGD